MKSTLYQPLTPATIDQLKALFGPGNMSTSEADRSARSFNVSGYPGHLGEMVVWSVIAEQTAKVLQLADKQHIPVTPWGSGTSVEGNLIPLSGGILLSTKQMQATLQLYPNDLQVTVEAGAKYKALNQ